LCQCTGFRSADGSLLLVTAHQSNDVPPPRCHGSMSSRTLQMSSEPPRCMLTIHCRQRGRSFWEDWIASPFQLSFLRHRNRRCRASVTIECCAPEAKKMETRSPFLSSVTCRCSSYLSQDKMFVHGGPLRPDYSSDSHASKF
jgi:hypothetical protein